MSAVSFTRVSKTYGRGVEVVKCLDLDIASGEFITLVGPSGCGKSTTLNLIAGFEAPTSGKIEIDGVVVNDLSPRQRGLAMVFQSYALYPHMDVRGNIGFPLEVAGVDRATVRARVEETAERLGLSALLERKPKELSGGQRQRVALGRALVRKPKLCLFDEPLSNLDATLRGQMRAEIKRLHEELGATFVYVTHDQIEAMTLSDRIVVLDKGVVQQVGGPREVYDRPANSFVASFIGSPRINLVPPAAIALVSAHGAGVVGIRPEHVTVGEGEPPEGALGGSVYVVEPAGSETWVTLDMGERARITGRAGVDFRARHGARAWLSYERDRVLLFDAATTKRIDHG